MDPGEGLCAKKTKKPGEGQKVNFCGQICTEKHEIIESSEKTPPKMAKNR